MTPSIRLATLAEREAPGLVRFHGRMPKTRLHELLRSVSVVAVMLATRNRRVGVIGTPATIRSHAYFEAIKDENPAVEDEVEGFLDELLADADLD